MRAAAGCLGLEAEPVEVAYPEVEALVRAPRARIRVGSCRILRPERWVPRTHGGYRARHGRGRAGDGRWRLAGGGPPCRVGLPFPWSRVGPFWLSPPPAGGRPVGA